MTELACHACGERLRVDEPVPRDAECARCGADLRACIQCRHWDARYHNQCTEPDADPIADRRRRNFCEFFFFSRAAFSGGAADTTRNRAAEARAKLDALFRKLPEAGE